MNLWLKLVLLALAGCTLFYLWNASEIKSRVSSDNPSLGNTLPVRNPLPMTFAHKDHSQQQCVTCHHNYQDNTGQGLCIECHITNEAIAFKFREQFHDLCIVCHVEQKQIASDEAGPLRACIACHSEDDQT